MLGVGGLALLLHRDRSVLVPVIVRHLLNVPLPRPGTTGAIVREPDPGISWDKGRARGAARRKP
jgi:hypothetical protein